MQKVSLYISATPWNFLNSFVFASQRSYEQSYLMYVDFPLGQSNPYLDALKVMGDESPFIESWCFHGKFKGVWQKWRSRVNELKELRQIVAELKPDQVFVGSDRRIEFQCAMTEAVKHNPQVKGIYLDEGMFSYTCRQRSQTWRDRVLDSWIKKLMYPCDWKHPITIGASDWISEGWLLKPERACFLLKDKINISYLDSKLYDAPLLKHLVSVFLSKDESEKLSGHFDVLMILPHPSQLTDEIKTEFKAKVSGGQFNRIAIKRHPRDLSSLAWLESSSIEILPSSLPLELLLPELVFEKVISAPSTAVLTATLLNPSAEIILVGQDDFLESLLSVD